MHPTLEVWIRCLGMYHALFCLVAEARMHYHMEKLAEINRNFPWVFLLLAVLHCQFVVWYTITNVLSTDVVADSQSETQRL